MQCPRCQQPCPPQALLSPRAQQILRLLARGLCRKEIAYELGVSRKTVDAYYMQLRQRLNLPHLHAVIVYAVRQEYERPAAAD